MQQRPCGLQAWNICSWSFTATVRWAQIHPASEVIGYRLLLQLRDPKALNSVGHSGEREACLWTRVSPLLPSESPLNLPGVQGIGIFNSSGGSSAAKVAKHWPNAVVLKGRSQRFNAPSWLEMQNLRPHPDLLTQKLWGGPSICVLINTPGDSDASQVWEHYS